MSFDLSDLLRDWINDFSQAQGDRISECGSE